MNEENQRRPLIKIRLSTLIFIVAVLLVILIIVAYKLLNVENKNEVAIIEEEVEIQDEEYKVPEKRELAITSRSLSERREEPVIEDVIEKQEEVIVEAPETTKIEDVVISKDMDLTIRTGLSREDFILLMSEVKADTSNFFEENAGLIYDVCEKYELNEIFFCGLISAESGWNIAPNHRRTHNYISLMSSNGLIKFASVEEGMENAAQSLHNNYLTPGGKFYYGPTLAGMKTKFCPASSTWVDLVFQRMRQIIK